MRKILSILLFAGAAWAQDPGFLDRVERQFDEYRKLGYGSTEGLQPSESWLVEYGGVVTLGQLLADDLFGVTRELRQLDAKLHARVTVAGHEGFGRLRFRYRDFSTGDSFDGGGDDLTEPIGDRYWYRYDHARQTRARRGDDPAFNVWAQVGRQQVDWASLLVLSETLYAARFGVEFDAFAFSGLVGRTPEQTTVDFDSSRPEYDTNTRRYFFAALLECRALDAHRPYVYFVNQQDENDTDNFGELFGYDSSYVAVGSRGQVTGRIAYLVEIVKEFGSGYSDPFRTFPQTIEDVDAWAGRIYLVYLPARLAGRGVRIELEVLFATGDDDRNHGTNTRAGNLSGTDDEAFNAFGFAYTGLALAPELSNLIAVRIGASALPFPRKEVFRRLRIGLDAFSLQKFDDDAPVDFISEPGEGHIGFEFDLVIDWRLVSDVTLELRYGIFVPGSAFPESDPRHFLYMGVSYAF